MRSRIACGAALGLIAVLGTPGLASAQATRTWVSGVGDDANPCARTAPCKTLAGAYSKTAVAGEIDALDPGGFGSLTVTHSINLAAVGVLAGILAFNTTGITINAPGATVSVRGFDIEGTQAGLNGISVVNAANLYLEDCSIHGFTQNGLLLDSPSAARIDIRHSSIFQNNVGVQLNGASAPAVVFIEDSAVKSNTSGNALVNGAAAALTLSNDTIVGANPGIAATGGAVVRSFGNNRINNGTPTTTSPLQ